MKSTNFANYWQSYYSSSSFFHLWESLFLTASREINRMSTHAELQQSAFLVWMLIAMMIPPLWRWRVRVDWWWLHHGQTIIIALAGHLVASHNTTGWPEIIITLLASIRPMGSGQVTWSLTTYGAEWLSQPWRENWRISWVNKRYGGMGSTRW